VQVLTIRQNHVRICIIYDISYLIPVVVNRVVGRGHRCLFGPHDSDAQHINVIEIRDLPGVEVGV
jgi:hypothetical protein